LQVQVVAGFRVEKPLPHLKSLHNHYRAEVSKYIQKINKECLRVIFAHKRGNCSGMGGIFRFPRNRVSGAREGNLHPAGGVGGVGNVVKTGREPISARTKLAPGTKIAALAVPDEATAPTRGAK